MHPSRNIFLLRNDVRVIGASYEPDKSNIRDIADVTNTFKSLDTEIVVGDFIVVPTDTRHGMTVMRVEEVDMEPLIESDSKIEWAIGIVDKNGFEEMERIEREIQSKIASAKRRKKQEELKAELLADMEEADLKVLDFAGDTQTETKE